jgi:hypothetical protein
MAASVNHHSSCFFKTSVIRSALITPNQLKKNTFSLFSAANEILPDHSNLYGKYDSPCIFNELCFQCSYPEPLQTVKTAKRILLFRS